MKLEKIKTRRWLMTAIEQSRKPDSQLPWSKKASAEFRRNAAARAKSA